MRIVAGKWRGRAVEAPEGRGTTRPTTDRLRETIASMVLSQKGLDLTGAHVLDAFAGSGAMGFELLSRGAQTATMVDQDRRAVARIRRSASALGADGSEVTALAGDVFVLAGRGLPGAPFDVVFLDPPYALEAARVQALVDGLASSGQIAEGAVVVYEHAGDAPGIAPAGFVVKKSKRQAIGAVDLLVAAGQN